MVGNSASQADGVSRFPNADIEVNMQLSTKAESYHHHLHQTKKFSVFDPLWMSTRSGPFGLQYLHSAIKSPFWKWQFFSDTFTGPASD